MSLHEDATDELDILDYEIADLRQTLHAVCLAQLGY
jgi:hypothetical protein